MTNPTQPQPPRPTTVELNRAIKTISERVGNSDLAAQNFVACLSDAARHRLAKALEQRG